MTGYFYTMAVNQQCQKESPQFSRPVTDHTYDMLSNVHLLANHSNNRAAACNLSTMTLLHFSAFVMLPSSKLSTRPGYVAPA